MKKSRKKETKSSSSTHYPSPEEAVQFLEDIRVMYGEKDEPTTLISLRVPANVLRAIKFKAKADGKKYQSLMIEYLRQGLKGTRFPS